jgi:uncharacterized protein (DUF305 family)
MSEAARTACCRTRSPRRPRRSAATAAGLALVLTLPACAVGSGAAGAVGAPRTAEAAAGQDVVGARPQHTAADVAFMQGMIAHHRQALEMTSLVRERTNSESIHLLAERIEVSQTDEIAMMSRWLETRGETVPAPGAHAHHAGDAGSMPGMLSAAEMASLADARGAAFDRRFLELMIRHHEGALTMVGRLLGTPGAGQEVDVYRIASEVDSDQRIEIERMQRMLDRLG